jgi:hypothetical protein
LLVLMSIVRNSGIQDRERVLASLQRKYQQIAQQEAQPPVDPNAQAPLDPVMQQLQAAAAQLELAKTQAEIARLNAQARLYDAQAQSEVIEPQLEAQRTAMRGIYNTPEEQMAEEFDRRMKAADLMVERERVQVERDEVSSNERIAAMQLESARASTPAPEIIEKPVPVPVPMPIDRPVPMPVVPLPPV